MVHKRLLATAIAIAIVLLAACRGEPGPPGPVGPAGAPGPVGPPGPAGQDATASQEFAGSEACGNCHEAIYETFIRSGHPHIITPIADGEPPTLPFDAESGGVPEPPEGYTWDDISYMVGGYGWKALFVDSDGYLITGDRGAATQFNFAHSFIDAPAEWVPYHPGEGALVYDCGECHSTGYRPQGHQDELEGIDGSWAAPGVQCEACHGPGSRHAADPQGVQMVVERNPQLCGNCHVRDNPDQIATAEEGSFEANRQQYSDLFNSRHFALSCITCHDPHATTIYAEETEDTAAGQRQQCTSCHWQKTEQKNPRHASLDCVDCHMPPMAFSAQGSAEFFIGDVHSHQFAINPDPEAPQFDEEGNVMPYITLSYACKQCHNGEYGIDRDLETLAAMAQDYHTLPTPTPSPTPEATATAEGTPATTPTASP